MPIMDETRKIKRIGERVRDVNTTNELFKG
jgi:hypothetical protein